MLRRPGSMSGNAALLDQYVEHYADSVARRRSSIALRAAKVEAEIAYKTRGQILANMNHELRTPLNAISGFASMLKDAETYNLDQEQVNEYLDYILQSSDLLLSHIDTILDLAAVESGGAKISRLAVDPGEILEEVVQEFREKAQKENVVLTYSADENVQKIDVDPEKIMKALRHLIENGLVYSSDEKTITSISLMQGHGAGHKETVKIVIQDTGVGMTPEELRRAMRAFEQVHQGLDRKFEGKGIGLPVAKSFVELNGGRFDISSEKGVGTRVTLLFPASKQQENADGHSEVVQKNLGAR